MSFLYTIEIRQRIKDAAHYMEWRKVPGKIKGRAALDNHVAYMIKQSHSLDIRAVRVDGKLRHVINYRIGE